MSNTNLPAVTADKGKAIIAAPSQYAANYSLSELSNISQAFQQSRMFPDIGSQAQALVKILAGKEMGIAPFASMTGIHIIKGKATVGANLMASLIKDSGRYDYKVTEHTATVCKIQFFEHGQPVGTSEFTIEDAKAAGVTGNDTWRKYPKNMLFARAMSNGMRWYCPNATSGQTVYTPEEMGANVDEEGNVINAPAEQLPPPSEIDGPPQQITPEQVETKEQNKKLVTDFRADAIENAKAAGIDADTKWVNSHIKAAASSLKLSAGKLPSMATEDVNRILQAAAEEILLEIEAHTTKKTTAKEVQAETMEDKPKDLYAGPEAVLWEGQQEN